jgi:DnaJ family protein B protein 12
MSNFLVSDPIYSFTKNGYNCLKYVSQRKFVKFFFSLYFYNRKYTLEKHTVSLKVPYYVKENFNENYDGNIRRLEANIEEEYVGMLRHNCYRERSQRESLLWRARQYGDKSMMVQALFF